MYSSGLAHPKHTTLKFQAPTPTILFEKNVKLYHDHGNVLFPLLIFLHLLLGEFE